MLWDLVEVIKLRVHEHLGPVRGVKFFGEEDRFIFSCDYKTIIKVAQKIPEEALQEDEKLLLWYDQALTRAEAAA